jgi:hypothetical protein
MLDLLESIFSKGRLLLYYSFLEVGLMSLFLLRLIMLILERVVNEPEFST